MSWTLADELKKPMYIIEDIVGSVLPSFLDLEIVCPSLCIKHTWFCGLLGTKNMAV